MIYKPYKPWPFNLSESIICISRKTCSMLMRICATYFVVIVRVILEREAFTLRPSLHYLVVFGFDCRLFVCLRLVEVFYLRVGM